ncbi:DUF2341 domain-containing protein [Thermofilum sp.]|uniref:DUF2341 domain-containing protein n=1 Tax=Thermofilum sp. TaxID=1961369 RepID=UPI003182E521
MPANFQHKLTIDTATLISQGKMRSDCGDLRFYKPDGTMLSYWIERGCNTSNTIVWVLDPDALNPNQSHNIYMYYGNPRQTSLSNPKSVWIFFEDFEGSRDPNWVDGAYASGKYEYASPGLYDNYRLHFKTGRSSGVFDNIFWKGQTFSNLRFVALVRADYSDDDSGVFFRSDGKEAGSSYNLNAGYKVTIPRAGNQYFILAKISGGSATSLASFSATNTTDIVRIEIKAYGSQLVAIIERPVGTYLGTLSANDTSFTSGYIGLSAPEWDSNRNPSFDMFCVGNYVYPEPSVTISTTEERVGRYPDYV